MSLVHYLCIKSNSVSKYFELTMFVLFMLLLFPSLSIAQDQPNSYKKTPGVSMSVDPSCNAPGSSKKPYKAALHYGKEINYMFDAANKMIIPVELNGHTYLVDIRKQMSDAFKIWAKYENFISFKETNEPNKANFVVVSVEDNIVSDTVLAMGFPKDVPSKAFIASDKFGGLLYFTNNIKTVVQLAYNYAKENGLYNGSDQNYIDIYVRALFVHEIGHTLGLNHSLYYDSPIPGSMVVLPYQEQYPHTPDIMDALADADGITQQGAPTVYLRVYKRYYNRTISDVNDVRPSDREIEALNIANNQAMLRNDSTCQNPYKEIPATPIITTGIASKQQTWLDTRLEGVSDLCNVRGDSIYCYENRNGDFSKQILSYKPEDLGWNDSRIFINAGFDKDTGQPVLGYCGLVYNWTSQRCYYFVWNSQQNRFTYKGKRETGYIDGGWSGGKTVLAGTQQIDDYRWYVDLENKKIHSYCRLVENTKMKCQINRGLDGFNREIVSNNIDPGWSGSRGWIDYKGGKAYCRLVDNYTRIRCLPFDKNKLQFGSEVTFDNIDGGYSGTRKWVDNFVTVEGVSQGAFCRTIGVSGSIRKWSCLVAPNFKQEMSYPDMDDIGWEDSLGFTFLPNSTAPTICSLIGSYTNIRCIIPDVQWDGSKSERIFTTAQSGYIDGGFPSVTNGSRVWLRYKDDNGLYCRHVNSADIACNRIYYYTKPDG